MLTVLIPSFMGSRGGGGGGGRKSFLSLFKRFEFVCPASLLISLYTTGANPSDSIVIHDVIVNYKLHCLEWGAVLSSSLLFLQLSSTSPSHPHSPHRSRPRARPKSTFMRVVNKLFTPIFGASAPPSTTTKRVKDCKLRKPFSRSLRA